MHPSGHQLDVVVVVVVRGRTCSGGTGLGELAGNAAVWERLTDIRFRPTGNPARLARSRLSHRLRCTRRAVSVAHARAALTRLPQAFRMNGNAFRKEGHTHTHTHTETMNQLLF